MGRKILAAGIGVLLGLATLKTGVEAADTINIDKVNFPDQCFREAVTFYFDKNEDGKLDNSEIQGATELDVEGMEDEVVALLKNTEGIEYFTELRVLQINGGLVETIDLSNNTKLEEVRLLGLSQLKQLNITNHTQLRELDCSYGKLTSLDISKSTELKKLDCSQNQLSSLDLAQNTKLEFINCSGNRLKNIDVLKCSKLNYLDCGWNELNSLNVSTCAELGILYCEKNKIKTLDVKSNPKLLELRCGSNQISSLVTSSNTKLRSLSCERNKLTKLNISKNTKLTKLNCSYNELKKLDVSKNKKLQELVCSGNKIKKLNVKKNKKLLALDTDHKVKLTTPSKSYINKKGTILSVRNTSPGSVEVKIKKVAGAKGYMLYYADNKKFSNYQHTYVGKSVMKIKLKRLEKGKTYYLRVCPYKNVYTPGRFSAVAKITIKK